MTINDYYKQTNKTRAFINKMYSYAFDIKSNKLYNNSRAAEWFTNYFDKKVNEITFGQDYYNIILIKKHYYHIIVALLDGSKLY